MYDFNVPCLPRRLSCTLAVRRTSIDGLMRSSFIVLLYCIKDTYRITTIGLLPSSASSPQSRTVYVELAYFLSFSLAITNLMYPIDSLRPITVPKKLQIIVRL